MAETIFYRPHWSHLDSDGTLHIHVSLYDNEGHASLVRNLSPTESDCSFWRWVSVVAVG